MQESSLRFLPFRGRHVLLAVDGPLTFVGQYLAQHCGRLVDGTETKQGGSDGPGRPQGIPEIGCPPQDESV